MLNRAMGEKYISSHLKSYSYKSSNCTSMVSVCLYLMFSNNGILNVNG